MLPRMSPEYHGAIGIVIFPALAQDFARAFQAGQRFGELGADLHDLHDRRNQEAKEQRVGEESADGQHPGRDSGARRRT